MPTADAYNPEGREPWIAVDGETEDARAARHVRRREMRLVRLRHTQWVSEVGREGALAPELDEDFDELEVRR